MAQAGGFDDLVLSSATAFLTYTRLPLGLGKSPHPRPILHTDHSYREGHDLQRVDYVRGRKLSHPPPMDAIAASGGAELFGGLPLYSQESRPAKNASSPLCLCLGCRRALFFHYIRAARF